MKTPDDPAMRLGAAITYALVGTSHRLAVLGTSTVPEVLTKLDQIVPGGLADVRRHGAQRRRMGEPWPHPVPPKERDGVGPARLAAWTRDLVDALTQADPRVAAERPLSADEVRLLRDRPPHHL